MSAQAEALRDRNLLRPQLAQGQLTDSELDLFWATAERLGLDPFAKQIYAMVREGERSGRTLTIEPTLAGYRVIAQRSGRWAGELGPQWCGGPDGDWQDVWLEPHNPAAARVAVLRHDFREPLWAVATWAESHDSRSYTWRQHPVRMLANAAERLALQRAFPIAEADAEHGADDPAPWVDLETGEIIETDGGAETGEGSGPPPGAGAGPAPPSSPPVDDGRTIPPAAVETQEARVPEEAAEPSANADAPSPEPPAPLPDAGGPATEEQWGRAERIFGGTRARVMLAYRELFPAGDARGALDITRGELQAVIESKLGGAA